MGEYTQWIEHKGTKILYVNYANIQDEEVYMRAIDEFEAEVMKQPKGHQMRVLVDVKNSVLTPRITERNKAVERKARESGVPDSPTAMVGLSGFKMAVVRHWRSLDPICTLRTASRLPRIGWSSK